MLSLEQTDYAADSSAGSANVEKPGRNLVAFGFPVPYKRFRDCQASLPDNQP